MQPLDKAQALALIGKAPDELNAEVTRRIEECISLLEQEMPGRKLVIPDVVYDLKGTYAGWAIHGKTIRLNLDLLLNLETHDEMMEQVVGHEVAHIVQHQVWPNSKSHGWQWKLLMNYLDLPANRTHHMQTKKARVHKRPYAYSCRCSELHYLTATKHNRMQRRQALYSCTRCGVYLTREAQHDT